MICLPLLVPMDSTSFAFDGLEVVESTTYTETRRVRASYTVDRSEGLSTTGEVDFENPSNERRRIRYRQSIEIPEDRRPWIEDGSPLCYDWSGSRVILVVESTLRPGETETKPIDWSVVLGIDADLNRDGKVDGADRGLLSADWGTSEERSDLNRDGKVDGADLGILFERWSS